MTSTTTSISYKLLIHPFLEELGVESIIPRGKNVLILGLRTSYKRLATPSAGDDPMDKPVRGLILAVGCDAAGEEGKDDLFPGQVCYFAKFQGSEISVAGRTFHLLDAGMVKAVDARVEDIAELIKNTY